MAVRQRIWKTKAGETREAWIVDYADADGERHIKTFARKKDADTYLAQVRVDVRAGVHVAPSKSVTIAEAGASWIKACEAAELERSTLKNYGEALRLHIVPLLGRVKLSAISVRAVRAFEDSLRDQGRTADTVKRIVGYLGSLLADAQERGTVATNAVHEMRRRRQGKRNKQGDTRRKLKVGEDIPTPDEIRAILSNAKGGWRPLLIVAAFTGLRASELRGLRWCDVDFKNGELHVRQRADRFNGIGEPKSASGSRTVPLPSVAVQALREWKLKSGPGDLVFGTRSDKPEAHGNIINRGFAPAQIAGGVTKDGKAKYTGLHCLRHFYASWCINRVEDGGLGLPAKNVQERLGHSKITMTLDVYGHLFTGGDDRDALDAGAAALLG
jgi:integrase